MAGRARLLDLAAGAAVLVGGIEWTIQAFEPQRGRLTLAGPDGLAETRSISWLINHPDVRASAPLRTAGTAIQPLA